MSSHHLYQLKIKCPKLMYHTECQRENSLCYEQDINYLLQIVELPTKKKIGNNPKFISHQFGNIESNLRFQPITSG